ncbi:MAG: hypothetical protein QNJ88_11590 [Acidimicrobiia bacterium]|nr:hypothetical protein [Acidimicrobiia bacterium]
MIQVPPTVGTALDYLGVERALVLDLMPRVDPDRVRLRVAPVWFTWLWARGIAAVTTPWAVYVHPNTAKRFGGADRDLGLGILMVHELMHVEQLARLGVLAHSIQYLTDYIRGRAKRLGHWEAYRQIRLEVEARAAASLVRSRIERAQPQ